ncbi:LysR substrate-binding domain-containing protein [Azospirillum endophyticum]|uniref:LysR substrate-binding domain-containing protein n=1 Tax=Azospirillum endophyticum TaxID=2800326 RepID=UPI001FFFC4CC|nr:LysR substrate-binding domain-containing protein [Azospirillum endophyticum]
MPAVSYLTARFAAAHPAATVEIRSMTSRAIQQGLDAFELDGGLTYLDNEPLDNVRRMSLYRERYAFATHRTNRHDPAHLRHLAVGADPLRCRHPRDPGMLVRRPVDP